MPNTTERKSLKDFDFSNLRELLYEEECNTHYPEMPMQECLAMLSAEREQRQKNEQVVVIAVSIVIFLLVVFAICRLLKIRKRIGTKVFNRKQK